MRIERVDQDTIKCYLSLEEMEEYKIDYRDFLSRSEKAQKLMHRIIEEAKEQVNYRPPKLAFELQITMMEQGMVLTFSEKEPFDLSDEGKVQGFVNNLKNLLGHLKAYQKELEEQGVSGDAPSRDLQAFADRHPEIPIFEEQPGQMPAATVIPTLQGGTDIREAVLCFYAMADVMDYAEVLPERLLVDSSLYKMEDAYYLHIAKGRASLERFRKTLILATEFASFFGAGEGCDRMLKEHGELLIERKAVQKLK